MRLPFFRYSFGICEFRELHYFLLCVFKAWLTHEVTSARTFVHLFCTCLPTPSEKSPLGEAFRHSLLWPTPGFSRLTLRNSRPHWRSLVLSLIAPQTAAARYRCAHF